MDGSMQRFIDRGAGLLSPQQLTLDRINRRIYFTDPRQNCIFELGYDGGRRYTRVQAVVSRVFWGVKTAHPPPK